MTKALREIDVKNDDLTNLNDQAIKRLFKIFRQKMYNMECGCGCNGHWGFTDEEVDQATNDIEVIKKELDTRGHIPSRAEKRKQMMERIKRGK